MFRHSVIIHERKHQRGIMISLYSFRSGFSTAKKIDGEAYTLPFPYWLGGNRKRKVIAKVLFPNDVSDCYLRAAVVHGISLSVPSSPVRFQDLMADCSNSTFYCYEILLFGFLSIWRLFNKHPSVFCHSHSFQNHFLCRRIFFFFSPSSISFLTMIYYLSGSLHFYCDQLKTANEWDLEMRWTVSSRVFISVTFIFYWQSVLHSCWLISVGENLFVTVFRQTIPFILSVCECIVMVKYSFIFFIKIVSQNPPENPPQYE